ncbi:hypothetical protein NMY22_g19455 [Coprinellus aureogranulatus]|nr:hypothetical protein NMY22_g19455 [Coprinellus aureogranulatus]
MNMGRFVDALAPYRSNLQALRRIDMNAPLDHVKSSLSVFNKAVESSTFHVYFRSNPQPVHTLFPDIRRLIVIVHATYVSIPTAMHQLEDIEILLRRPLVDSRIRSTTDKVKHAIVVTQGLLRVLLGGRYPMLRSVAIWKCTEALNLQIDGLVSDYRARFWRMGISLHGRRAATATCHERGLASDKGVHTQFVW